MDIHIKSNLKINIRKEIADIFPVLNIDDIKFIYNLTINILRVLYIYTSSDVEDINVFIDSLLGNISSIILLLLPHMNNKHELINIRSIFTYRKNKEDINLVQPVYHYSNIQYNRCIRGNYLEEKQYSNEYIVHNYILLIETIYTISNKLYPNLINIFPYSMENYKFSNLYINTLECFQNKKIQYYDPQMIDKKIEKQIIDLIIDNKNMLTVNDIYNTIANDLYHNIKTIKWFLYDINNNNNISILIECLENILPLSECMNNVSWKDFGRKEEFSNRWNNLKKLTGTNYNYDNNKKILQTILNHNGNKDDPRSVYIFLQDKYQLFNNTIYGYYFRTGKHKNIKYFGLKNIYDYSKSLLYIDNNELPRYWCSVISKKKIIDRLKDDDNINNWFNVKNKIMNIYNINNKHTASSINEDIYIYIRQNIIDIIFECLTYRGVLTYYSPNIIDKNKYIDAYHPISRKKYDELKKIEATDIFNIGNQLNIYHHYINNRIIFVTGSTGIGKSTKLPILYMYSLAIIYYNIDGKILCTQPRIKPVQSNADAVSSNLGIPITDNAIANNYVIQYEYGAREQSEEKTSKYTKDNIHSIILKFVTDGLLYKQLLKDPNLTFDAIIVDESHEHNIYMDLMLTFLRNYIYYYPNAKLIISSATMESDELIYRRYYRNINDNLSYPPNQFIKNNKIDRINVDRRIHIEKKNMFKKNEITLPNHSVLNVVKKILDSNKNGDILIFESGVKKIMNLVDSINKNTSESVLAIPYYRNLNKEAAQYIIQFDEKRNKIRIPKNYDFNDIGSSNYVKTKNPYRQIIIISTDIAEASITIGTLKFVIDTGIRNIATFKYKYDALYIEEKPITPNARIQRKGRVGRTSDGTVYYLYELKNENDLSILNLDNENIKIISEDFHSYLYELLFSKITFSKTFFENYTFCEGTEYKYYGNNDHYDYENNNIIEYEIEYDRKILNDMDGTFYIIHPCENEVSRNMNGELNKRIISEKMLFFWEKLIYYNLITKNKNIYTINKDISDLYIDLAEKLLWDSNKIISIIKSIEYDCLDELLGIYSILHICNYGNIYEYVNTKFISQNPAIPDIELLFYMYSNQIMIRQKNVDDINKKKEEDKKMIQYVIKNHNIKKKMVNNLTTLSRIKICLINGYYNNMIYYMDNKYVNFMNPHYDNLYIIKNDDIKSYFVLYLKINMSNGEVNIITSIDNNLLKYIPFILQNVKDKYGYVIESNRKKLLFDELKFIYNCDRKLL